MTTPPRGVSVTVPVGQAIDRVKAVLFQPFDIGKWFVIGFAAWLAYLGERGGWPGNFNVGHHEHKNIGRELEQLREFVLQNIAWIAPLVIGLTVFFIVIWLVLLWLSSRGRFMFLHCVALNKGEVQVPWTKFSREGNSLFLFRLVLSLISLVFTLPLVAGLILTIIAMVRQEAFRPPGILLIVLLVLGLILVAILFWIIGRLTTDFVVPIQFLRRCRCLEAWSEFGRLSQGNWGNLIVYFLFQIVLGLVIGMLVLMVVIMTCCLAGCLAAIPYFGTVFLLPLLVFERSYSLHYLAQFGNNYNVFQASETSPPIGS